LYSESYAKQYLKYLDNGAISAEIGEMIVRRRAGVPIVVLSLEPYTELVNKLPWQQLGYEGGVPAIGQPLRSASDEEFGRAIDDALRRIDADMVARRKSSTKKNKNSRRK
jgi:hypothetical protein